MKNLEKQQKCTMYEDQCTTNGNTGSLDFANATAFASLKMTNNNCHAELVEASCRFRSSLSRAAFTLVELVITIAIVIILSVISVPIYRGYVDKAKMSEGYALLGQILSAQKNYYSEYGNFLDDYQTSVGYGKWTRFESVLGIDARGNKYFTYFWVDTQNANNHYKYTFSAYVLKPSELTDGAKKSLKFLYDITTGSTFIDNGDVPFLD